MRSAYGSDDARTEARVRRILFVRRHRSLLILVAVPIGALIGVGAFFGLLSVAFAFAGGSPVPGILAPVHFIIFLIGPVLLPVTGLVVGGLVANRLTNRPVPYGYCGVCGYNLQAFTVPRCPECGTPSDVSADDHEIRSRGRP